MIWRRILRFNKQDWKHICWLLKNMVKQFFLLNINDAKEAALLVYIHFKYDSERIR